METLMELLNAQLAFRKLNNYENELETIRALHDMPSSHREHCEKLIVNWLKSLQRPKRDVEAMKKESEQFRTKGNEILKGSKKDLVAAISCYTKAIYAAPPGDVLSLAHANRAVALQEFGYFQQAYDDCEIAIAQGYPERLQHKILCRKAFCAWKLNEVELLEHHLMDLEKSALNENFTQQVNQLNLALHELRQKKLNKSTKDDELKKRDVMCESLDIMVLPEPIGRHFIANRRIQENEIICTERASSFVPVGKRGICQNCADSMIIPFPCKSCECRAVYCSLKCFHEHSSVHKIECPGMRLNLFSYVGISHLALRTLIDGLPQLLPVLQQKKNIDELWAELLGGNAISSDYGLTMQMVTHIDKMLLPDILRIAQVAELLVVYLREYTNFFDCFKEVDIMLDQDQLELLVASLILRHSGQLLVNGFASASIVPLRSEFADPIFDGGLLTNDIWCKPFHIKRGKLHILSDYEENTAINFPYLSIANHACDPNSQIKFSGRYMSAYANKTIPVGEEVTHGYIDSQNSKNDERRSKLRELYYFDCLCIKCTSTNPDEDYEKFHQYRCEYENCQKIFVPKTDDRNYDISITCNHCGRAQYWDWLKKFNSLLECVHNAFSRRMLYKIFNKVERWLVGFNAIKLNLADRLTAKCFAVHNSGFYLNNDEFDTLAKIIKFNMEGAAAINRMRSIDYIVKMVYLWDLIALEKFKCTIQEGQKMFQVLEVLSDEIKMIYASYFEEYIRPVLV